MATLIWDLVAQMRRKRPTKIPTMADLGLCAKLRHGIVTVLYVSIIGQKARHRHRRVRRRDQSQNVAGENERKRQRMWRGGERN